MWRQQCHTLLRPTSHFGFKLLISSEILTPWRSVSCEWLRGGLAPSQECGNDARPASTINCFGPPCRSSCNPPSPPSTPPGLLNNVNPLHPCWLWSKGRYGAMTWGWKPSPRLLFLLQGMGGRLRLARLWYNVIRILVLMMGGTSCHAIVFLFIKMFMTMFGLMISNHQDTSKFCGLIKTYKMCEGVKFQEKCCLTCRNL